MKTNTLVLAMMLALSCGASTTSVAVPEDEKQDAPATVPTLIEPFELPRMVMKNDTKQGRAMDLGRHEMFSAQAQRTVDNLWKDKRTASIDFITVHESMLSDDVVGTFHLPGLEPFSVSGLDVMKTETGLTWSGLIADALGGEAILSIDDGEVSGTMWVHGDLYFVRSLGSGVSALVKVDQSAFPPDHPPEPKKQEEDSQMDAPPPAQCSTTEEPTTTTNIRVLVAATEAVSKKLKDTGTTVNALVDVAIQETNLGFDRSKVKARVELAGLVEVDYNERGSFFNHVERFAKADDGVMDEIHAIRDDKKADLCVLLVRDRAACGYARKIDAGAADAFVVVSEYCATGYYSFGHEIGHLLAARHDPDHDSASRPFVNGHGFQDGEKRFRTIMAYPCGSPCPRRPNWSNPDVKLMETPTGTQEKHFNACVLNERAPVAATFR